MSMNRRNLLNTLLAGAVLPIPVMESQLDGSPDRPSPSLETPFFTQDMFLANGKPVERPKVPNYVFAITDNTGVVYFGRWRHANTAQLTILDWQGHRIQTASVGDRLISAGWLRHVNQRLQELTSDCRAIQGNLGVFIEDQSIADIHASARPIDSRITALSAEERMLNASSHITSGSVKITREAYEKGAGHLMLLLDCIVYGTILALGAA